MSTRKLNWYPMYRTMLYVEIYGAAHADGDCIYVCKRKKDGVWVADRGSRSSVQHELPGVTTAKEAMMVVETLYRMGEL